MEHTYAEYAAHQAVELLAIDSPTGYTAEAEEFVLREFRALGFAAERTAKGGILIDLGGENADDALLLEAHADTLGGMVAEIKGDGRLRIVNVGGMNANNAEGENVKVYTHSGKVYEGTAQLCNASIHVNGDYNDTKRTFDTLEVVLDENVSTAKETQDLGISAGDMVCFDPRTRRTETGYLKSRFLDDKLSVGILLGFALLLALALLARPLLTAYLKTGAMGMETDLAGDLLCGYNRMTGEAFAATYQWDGREETMDFTVPDMVFGYRVTALGG